MSCDSTNSIYQDGLVDGQYSCRTANESSDASTLRIASSGADDSTNNNGAPNGTDTAAGQESDNSMAIGAGVGVGVGVPLLLALAGWLWWRRRRTARRDSSSAQALQEKDGSEVDRGHMLGYDVQKHELEHPLGEMPIGGEAQELPAKHGQVELPAGIDSRHEMPAEELKLIEKKDAENTKSES